MRYLLLFLPLYTLLSFSGQPHATRVFRPGKDFALFFAVNQYKNWGPLKYPISEAEAIAKDLHDLYGFDTLIVRNPTKAEIKAKIDFYRSKIYAKDAQLFIYFSGHGEFVEETKEGFFIPKEGEKKDPSQDSYLSYLRLKQWITTLPCNHILLSIDACFSGTFDDDIALKGDPGVRPNTGDWREQFIQQSLEYRSRWFMASGAKVRTPDKSAFAQQFLAALRGLGGDDKLLSFTELWSYIQRANPKPCAATFGDHQPGGDFLFVLQKSARSDVDNWNEAKAINTIAGYEAYITKCQNKPCDFVDAADAKITTLRESQKPTKPDYMVLITGGTFQMGSEDGETDEKPVHKVTISDFYLAKYEVTVAEFRAFMEANPDYETDAEKEGSSYGYEGTEWKSIPGRNWRHDPEGNPAADNHPVINVSWNDATAYCAWMNQKTGKSYRLPTEAEWEYAAGNGSRHTKYSWGNDAPSGKNGGNVADETKRPADGVGWTTKFEGYNDGYWFTAPVGAYNANNFGLFDMTGNVWEWCSDWYGSDYYKNSPASNPIGPSSGSDRGLRGGSWDSDPQDCRVAVRYNSAPGDRGDSLGFRLARTK